MVRLVSLAGRRQARTEGPLAPLGDWLGGGSPALFYQPQVCLRTRAPIAFEALIRWRHPTAGTLAPAAFLPYAESSGVMRALTLYVVSTAAKDLARWRRDGIDATVAVNVPVTLLAEPGVVDDVRAVLEATAMVPGDLRIEITEHDSLDEAGAVSAALAALADLGVGLSIDDFGAGYSSLGRVADLPITELKIDRSLVAGLMANRRAGVIVRSTIEMARDLGLIVTGEGAETAAVLEELARMGCHRAQGFHIARPMPVDDVSAWTRSWAIRSASSLPSNAFSAAALLVAPPKRGAA